MEVAELRTALAQPIVPQPVSYQAVERTAHGTPMYLPPVETRR
jgi:hypothetical protein